MPEEKTVEEKAKQMGFVTKEDWKGDPDKWRPPEEFVERGENIIPILKKNLDETNKKLDSMKSDFDFALKANAKEVEDAKKAAFDLATKNYEDKLAQLNSEEEEAVQDQDLEKYHKIKKQKEKLAKPSIEKAEPKKDTEKKDTPPEFVEWNKKETWYGKDEELTAEADMIGTGLAMKYPDKPLKEVYGMISDRVKRMYPDKFKNPHREESQSVEGHQPKQAGDKKGFNSLPPTAKDQYKRLAAQFKEKGRKYTKEEFTEAYYE